MTQIVIPGADEFGVRVNHRTPLAKVIAVLRRHNPEAFYSKTISRDGHFLYALPAVPIEINVSAPGYQPWRYRDPTSGTENLTLSSSDHRVMTIELVPLRSKQ